MSGLAIRTRLTLVFAGMTVVVLGVAVIALVLGFRSELWRSVDEGLARASVPRLRMDPLDGRDVDDRLGRCVRSVVESRTGILASSPGLGDGPLPLPPSDRLVRAARFFEADVTLGGDRYRPACTRPAVQDGSMLVVGVKTWKINATRSPA